MQICWTNAVTRPTVVGMTKLGNPHWKSKVTEEKNQPAKLKRWGGRNTRRLRLREACRSAGIPCRSFVEGIKASNIAFDITRFIDLAKNDPKAFKRIVEIAKDSLRSKPSAESQAKTPRYKSKPTNAVIGNTIAHGRVAIVSRRFGPIEDAVNPAKPKTKRTPSMQTAGRKLEATLAEELVDRAAKTSPDVNVLCGTYGLRREELARLTGFSLRALADWSTGKLPSQPALRRLHEIRRLLDSLAEFVSPTAIPDWLRRTQSAFDNLTPLQIIEVGEIDRLWAMVHERSGAQ